MTYLITIRLIHIICSVFWAGATMYLAWFIIPAVQALGPDGGKFMQQLSRTNRLPLVMMAAGTLTILSGILVIEQLSDGFRSAWFGTPHGIILSTGGTFALIGYILGLTVNMPTVNRISSIGKKLQGAPPAPEQLQELQALRNRLFTATRILALLLLAAALCMAVFRYI